MYQYVISHDLCMQLSIVTPVNVEETVEICRFFAAGNAGMFTCQVLQPL